MRLDFRSGGSAIGMAFLLSGCAHVDFYQTKTGEPDDGQEKHLQPAMLHVYLDSTPYLVVVKTKDGARASVVFLKDPKSKIYVQQHQGWGTANMTFQLANGLLTSYGLATDSKGPETITSLASLGSSGTGIGALMNAVKAQSAKAYPIEAKNLRDAAVAFAKALPDQGTYSVGLAPATASDQVNMDANKIDVSTFDAASDDGKNVLADLTSIATKLNSVDLVNVGGAPATKAQNDAYQSARKSLIEVITTAVGSINKDAAAAPGTMAASLEVFKMDLSTDPITLIPVKVPKTK